MESIKECGKITLKIFKDEDDFKKRDNELTNGVTQEFLDSRGLTLEDVEVSLKQCKGCFNCYNCSKCTDCYECTDCVRCSSCARCNKCFMCFDCVACSKCLHCINLYERKKCERGKNKGELK